MLSRAASIRSAVVAGFVAFGIVHAQDAPKSEAPVSPTAKINELIAKSWKENNLKPSVRTSNWEFLRRVYLDLIGRIATPAEVRWFEANPNRAKLVHRLLYEKATLDGREFNYPEEYAENWANVWSTWLMTRTSDSFYRGQLREWLIEYVFTKNLSHKEMVEKLITATGKTNEVKDGAVNYILQHLGEEVKNETDREGHFDFVPVTSRTSRLFMGLQTQCVQCHDHPFNPEWKQQNFWGVNVFFRQVKRDGRPNAMRANAANAGASVLTLSDDDAVNKEGLASYEKRSGVVLYTKGVFLDGRKPDIDSGSKTRRQHLAELIASSEQFPKAYVNRIWGHLFGRGLNEQPSVDDFGEHNKVVHPELLDYLAKEFAAETPSYEANKYNGFDPKKLLYWICTSEPYQLSSVANATNDKTESDVFFSRMLLKSLTPEQLFESLQIATGAAKLKGKERQEQREAWLKKLVVNFGDDEGNELTFNGTLLQALMLMNGKEITDAIKNTDKGTVAEAMRKSKSGGRIIDDLFVAALNRHPQGNEASRITSAGTKYRDAASFYFYSDVLWALLNSNEFILNH
ncbi:MAG: DUF1549 domain-containing protein [Gemmataceae bacterium]